MIHALLIAVTLSTLCAERKTETAPSSLLTIQLTAGRKELHIQAERPIVFEDGRRSLPPGAYTVEVSGAHAAQQQFRLFVKTFPPNETQQAKEYLAQWKAQGYDAEILSFGRAWKLDSGTIADNRNQWISVARLPSLDKANAFKADLEKKKVWTWVLPDTVEQGRGKLHFKDSRGKEQLKMEVPCMFHSDAPIRVSDVDVGFWKNQKQARGYSGTLEIRVGPGGTKQGLLELYEHVELEAYLAGVLPAEMPAGWPGDALKAQAVAARSDVTAALGGKHALEGFDFCGGEHCRAYGGASARQESTDAAVSATRGVVLAAEGKVVPAVFSANCGGWTEKNDTVWSSPPNAALRGIADFAARKSPASGGPQAYGMEKWLRTAPQAFCSGEREHYRWTKRFTAKELSEVVNKRYAVGPIRSVELGERGVSGRLKWVKVVGAKKTQVVRKDLDIRLAFGGLNSAMFMVDVQGRPGSPESFTFTGGGRGHGVGLCQDGARGMAGAGVPWPDIVKHYFPVATLARLP